MKFLKRIFFKGHTFQVCREVYEPAEDTFLLAENLTLNGGERVLDVGTGCGILGILAAEKAMETLALDINPHAVRCARMNARLNNVESKMSFICGDLFNPIRIGEKFDLIIFNAPYLPAKMEGREWIELAWSGGSDGREIMDRFLFQAPNYLSDDGRILLVQSSLSNINKTMERFKEMRLKARVIAEEKLDFEKIVVIEAERRHEHTS